MDAIARYPFDYSLTADIANAYAIRASGTNDAVDSDLTNRAVVLADPSKCREFSCAFFPSVASVPLLDMPNRNFADNPGLTFSVWFRPTLVGNYVRIFDFGRGASMWNVLMAKLTTTDKMTFAIRRQTPAGTQVNGVWTSGPGVWVIGQWRHIVWSLEPVGTGMYMYMYMRTHTYVHVSVCVCVWSLEPVGMGMYI